MATATGTKFDFASVLDELLRDEAERRAAASRPATSLDFLSVIDEIGTGLVVSDDALTSYRNQARDEEEENPVRASVLPTPPLPSTDLADIARELGLSGRKKPDELDAMRRRFAMANHPDRVAPELRSVSMVRMQVANMLIDEAKRGGGRFSR